jgi:hypothetical protein
MALALQSFAPELANVPTEDVAKLAPACLEALREGGLI